MAEQKSRYVVEGEFKGGQRMERDFSAVAKTVARMTKQMDMLGRTMQQFGKQGAAQMDAFRKAAEGATKAFEAMQKAGAKGQGNGPSFGKMAGASFVGNVGAQMWQRGGQALSGLASMPRTGAAGLTQALGAIPIVGGAAAGLTGGVLDASQQYQALEMQRYGMRWMGRGGVASSAIGNAAAAKIPIHQFDQGAVDAAGAAARAAAYKASMADVGGSHFDQAVQAAAMVKQGKVGGARGWRGAVADAASNGLVPTAAVPFVEEWANNAAADQMTPRGATTTKTHGTIDYQTRLEEGRAHELMKGNREKLATQGADLAEAEARKAETEAQNKRIKEDTDKAEAERRRAIYNASIEGIGVQYGMKADEANTAAMALARAHGGGRADLMRNDGDLLKTAMGAQAHYGIGVETSGTLARGLGMGAIKGGSLEAVMANVAGAARGRGLGEADTAKALEDMAASIKQFEQTGIPLAPESIMGMQQSFSTALGAQRGSVVGAQLVQSQQAKGMNAPGDQQDVSELIAMYGYEPGSGAEGLLAAKKKQAKGQIDVKGFKKYLEQGGGAQGELMGMEAAKHAGFRGNWDELQKYILAGDEKGVRRVMMKGTAKGEVAPGSAQRGAATANEVTASGAKAVELDLTLKKAQADALMQFGKFMPDLTKAVQGVLETIGALEKMIPGLHQKLAEGVK